MGGSLDSVVSIAQVNGIQVVLQDHIFILYLFFQFQSQVPFLELTLETLQSGLIYPIGKNIIFYKLLSDSTGTL